MKSKLIFLNLFLIDFPITAIASIIHRVTGILLFFFMPFFLYFLKISVESNSSFNIAKNLISKNFFKFLFLFLFLSFLYHSFNGIKHMIMDLGFFDSMVAGRKFTISTIIFVLCLFIGFFYVYFK